MIVDVPRLATPLWMLALTLAIGPIGCGGCEGPAAPDGGADDAGAGEDDAGEADAGAGDDAGYDAGAPTTDAGGTDAGDADSGVDAGAEDSGVADSGVDAGSTDAGPSDAGGAADAGPVDAGPSDAGRPADGGYDAGMSIADAGRPADGGPIDAGMSIADAGRPADGGPIDAGPPDSGYDGGYDAGRPADGGHDAGPPDSGYDGGYDAGRPADGGYDAGPPDSGYDGGYDAGRPADGGYDAGPPDSGYDGGYDAGRPADGGYDAGPPDSGYDGGYDAGRPADGGYDAGAPFDSGPIDTTLTPTADPLLRMPGTQPGDAVTLEEPTRCMNCHSGFDAVSEPGSNWQGSMMAQAARDPIFWAAFTVALQDSAWALGTPNAGDLCLRCHMPRGWVAGRSNQVNGGAMTGGDFDGVSCDVCHRMYDPFFATAPDRENTDLAGYWDESGTLPALEAADTFAADIDESGLVSYFNGNDFFALDNTPDPAGYTESSSGQFFVADATDKRGPFADANGRHGQLYSRFHKSRYFCGTCHDVSNPALANINYAGTAAGDGSTVLPTEGSPASSYFHVERTFSEFMLSAYGTGDGAFGTGAFDPSVFDTSRPGERIATCQDCHMRDVTGVAAEQNDAVLRPDDSLAHPASGVPKHEIVGGNAWVPWILASTDPSSSNWDPTNEALLRDPGPAVLTLDLDAGLGLNPDALLSASQAAIDNLGDAATIESVSYDDSSGALSFRIVNHTGHKLISGYPEGRRMFINIRAYAGSTLLREVNPYDDTVGTLRGLPLYESPDSPPLGANETHDDDLVYEVKQRSDLTGESHTFHMVLATDRTKDNRIPPQGFRIDEAADRMAEPVRDGLPDPSLFSAAEYAGGWDDVSLTLPAGADRVEVTLWYQTTSREFISFLRNEINGTGGTLVSPTPSGRHSAYVAAWDPLFDSLRTWGDTIWALWLNNKDVPGAAPVFMTSATWTP
jgi:hypothetical protein